MCTCKYESVLQFGFSHVLDKVVLTTVSGGTVCTFIIDMRRATFISRIGWLDLVRLPEKAAPNLPNANTALQ